MCYTFHSSILLLHNLMKKDKLPGKSIKHKALLDSTYHVDATFADAVYGHEDAKDPEAALITELAKKHNVRMTEITRMRHV
jgi:hypothetical protein